MKGRSVLPHVMPAADDHERLQCGNVGIYLMPSSAAARKT